MESLRLWVGDQIAKFMPKPEDQIKESAAMLEQGLKDADKAKHHRTHETDPVNRERPSFNTRVTRVDTYERMNMFIPEWKALYEEKHGRLARVGFHQHVETNRETWFTRARKEREAAQQVASTTE